MKVEESISSGDSTARPSIYQENPDLSKRDRPPWMVLTVDYGHPGMDMFKADIIALWQEPS